MAVIHTETYKGKRYEIRTAGASTRLYTNGVFHSQFNPNQRHHGSVWDLLCLPAWLGQPAVYKNVLILGVGGGAVIRMLQPALPGARFTGIELDAVHIRLARKFFNVPKSARLIQADAGEWVRQQQDADYDLIIDDLFGDNEGETLRAINADRAWLDQLGELLSPAGTLVVNFSSTADFRKSAFANWVTDNGLLPNSYTLGHKLLDNIVAVSSGRSDQRPGASRLKQMLGSRRAKAISVKAVKPARRQ